MNDKPVEVEISKYGKGGARRKYFLYMVSMNGGAFVNKKSLIFNGEIIYGRKETIRRYEEILEENLEYHFLLIESKSRRVDSKLTSILRERANSHNERE
tara:strand:- start:3497 stop:3793 length:297 start_codon:yes stop_codon:yes gene_type:complete